MRMVAAPLAAVLAAIAIGGCGGDGAEPGAPEGATLVLDFTPNAVHSGLFAAQRRGYFADAGIDLEIREPSSTADGAKLLEAGRAEFAILDINDFAVARERGLGLLAVAAIVQRPLASVIAADRDQVRAPADLRGMTVGVTGVPSDQRVLDTILRAGGVGPDEVSQQTIGFQSVPLLAAGRVDAATAFWNAEGVALREMGVPTREFRVQAHGAPRYPELLLVTRAANVNADGPFCGVFAALEAGYEVLRDDPDGALQDLLDAVPELDPQAQELQFDALEQANAFSPVRHPRGVSPMVLARSLWRFGIWASVPELSVRDRVHELIADYELTCLPARSG